MRDHLHIPHGSPSFTYMMGYNTPQQQTTQDISVSE